MTTTNRDNLADAFQKAIAGRRSISMTKFHALLDEYRQECYAEGYDTLYNQMVDLYHPEVDVPEVSSPDTWEHYAWAKSSNGVDRYNVEWNRITDELRCECKAFIYSSDRNCKHIRKLLGN